MADEVSAIEKPAEKGTRVDMKKLLTKVMKTASKGVKKDLEKQLETLKAMKHGVCEGEAWRPKST